MNAGHNFVPVLAIAVSAEVKGMGGSQTTHRASFYSEIVYRYSVEGKEYQSTRCFFTGEGWPDQRKRLSNVILPMRKHKRT
jgi:hypothetical protein